MQMHRRSFTIYSNVATSYYLPTKYVAVIPGEFWVIAWPKDSLYSTWAHSKCTCWPHSCLNYVHWWIGYGPTQLCHCLSGLKWKIFSPIFMKSRYCDESFCSAQKYRRTKLNVIPSSVVFPTNGRRFPSASWCTKEATSEVHYGRWLLISCHCINLGPSGTIRFGKYGWCTKSTIGSVGRAESWTIWTNISNECAVQQNFPVRNAKIKFKDRNV